MTRCGIPCSDRILFPRSSAERALATRSELSLLPAMVATPTDAPTPTATREPHSGFVTPAPTASRYATAMNDDDFDRPSWLDTLERMEFFTLLEKYRDLFLQAEVTTFEELEDKIIRRVRDAGVSLREFTAVFERAFFEDLERLRG